MKKITFKIPSDQCNSAAFKNSFLVQYKSEKYARLYFEVLLKKYS